MAPRKDIGNVDAALEELGSFGRYSMVQFFMQILAQFAVAHHMLSIVFTGQKNPYRCPELSIYNGSNLEHSDNLSLAHSSVLNSSGIAYDSVCHSTSLGQQSSHSSLNVATCSAYNVEYLLPKDRFFASEFDLVCDREYLAGLTQTLLVLGHAIGSMMFPYFADTYGRKPILLICSFLWLGSSMGLVFSVSYVMFAIFKTLVGVFLQGVAQTSCTVMVEILTIRQRGYMFASLAFIFWTIGTMLLAPVAYVLRYHSWRVLELAYFSYFVFILLYIFLMDESLRWLAANGFGERVITVLKRASKWNGSKFDSVVAAFYKENETENSQFSSHHQLTDTCHDKSNFELLAEKKLNKESKNGGEDVTSQNGKLESHDQIDENLNVLSLFKNRHLRLHTAFNLAGWFFNSLTYYALLLMSSSLSGSIYLNYFLSCVVELPSAILIYFTIDRLGRKKCFAMLSFIAGASLVAMALTAAVSGRQSIIITVLAIIGKFGISGSFSTLYTYTPELIPTNIRNTGSGLANLFACLGGMLSPFASLLMSKVVYAPGLIFGFSSLLMCVWAYFLPETANRQLPQSLREIENWSSGSKKKDDRSPIN